MTPEQWTAVDQYISESMIPEDPVLETVLKASTDAGLPAINVSPAQGKFLHLLTKIHGARTILEIGTLGGYSTIWLARGMLPAGGKVVTLEVDPRHARVARANFENAGLTKMIEVKEGRALDTLPELAAAGRGPFDLIFIDADKVRIPEYFTWALKLSRRGTVIIVDNVIRKGAVTDGTTTDPSVQGVRQLNEMLKTETRVTATTLQTVGAKGYDGFMLAVVN
ncbi:MAG: O-methyltransferase [Opitutaceae bacterium]